MLTQYEIRDNKIIECNESGKVLIYLKPDKNEIDTLINQYGIDEHDLSSALDPDELGRLDFAENHVVIILKRPNNYSTRDNLLFKVTSVGIFLFKDRIIIVMIDDIQILEGRQSKKLETVHDVLIRLIYGTISHFLGHLKVIHMMSESLEQKIDISLENRYLINMFNLQKSLVFYFNGINSNSILFGKIRTNSSKIGFTEENIDILDDVIIENQQCFKQTEISLSIISGIMSAHASIVGNNLNLTIHRLTFITTIFMPLSVIAGIGGMSEWTMMTGQNNWKISYPILMVIMAIMGLGMFFVLRRISPTHSTKKTRKSFFKKLFRSKAKPDDN